MLVTIKGKREVVQGLRGVGGLHLSLHSDKDLGGGVWSVSGYASEEAVRHAESLGCTVTVVMTSQQVEDAIRSGSGANPPVI
jgi:hypothetical protein